MNYLQLPEVGVPVLDDKELRKANWKTNLSAAMKGKPASEAKIAAMKGKPASEAKIAAMKGKPLSEERKAKIAAALKGKPSNNAAALSKPCTVDGITLYPNLKALSLALGQGKAGAKHPNFRYIEKK